MISATGISNGIEKRLEALENALAELQDKLAKKRQYHKPRNAKLQETDIPQIRALSALGYSQHRIASVFGVSRAAIQAIVEHKSWRHVA